MMRGAEDADADPPGAAEVFVLDRAMMNCGMEDSAPPTAFACGARSRQFRSVCSSAVAERRSSA